MRTLLVSVALLTINSAAVAQQPVEPERLLPAGCLAFFRYDGYEPHRKAYDRTALAKAMKEGLGDFLDHVIDSVGSLAGLVDDDAPLGAKASRPIVDGFLGGLSRHGFALTVEVPPPGRVTDKKEDFQLTIVFPQGAETKNRAALEKFLRLAAESLGAAVEKADCGGRAGHKVSFDGPVPCEAAWWAEGKHLLFVLGNQPVGKALRVVDGKRPNLTTADWFKELAGFKGYETDMHGRVDLQAVVDHVARFGLTEPGLQNVKDRIAREVALRHLGLTGLKDLRVHLGFEGKFQRSTIRLGVVEAERRTGLLRLLSAPATFDSSSLMPGKLPPLPPDADLVSVRQLNWENVYDYVRGSVHLLSLSHWIEIGEAGKLALPDLEDLVGPGFRTEFLQQLGDTTVTWGGHSEGPFFLGQGFAVKVKNAVKVRKILPSILAALEKQHESLKTDKQVYRGREMYVFSKLTFPVSLTVHRDWLVLGLFPQPVQGFLLRSGGKYRTWKAPPEFDEALARERKEPGRGKLLGLSVSDPRPAVTIGLSLLPAVAKFGREFGVELDVKKIPNSQTINEWLFPNTAFLYDDGDALRWEHHYSMNEADDLLLLALPMLIESAAEYLPIPAREQAVPTSAKRGVAGLSGPTLCPASAVEKDGKVEIRVSLSYVAKIPYTTMVKVERQIKGDDGKIRTVVESVPVESVKLMQITEIVDLIPDGKKVHVTHKEGKPVDVKELPKLLEKQTKVLVVPGDKIDPEDLRKLDDRTLVVRVAVPKEAPPPEPAPAPPGKRGVSSLCGGGRNQEGQHWRNRQFDPQGSEYLALGPE